MSQQITLKLYEILTLDVELNGARDPQTGRMITPGLLGLTLPIVSKYWITEIANNISTQKKAIEVLRDELIKEYGKKGDNDSYQIEMYEDPKAEVKKFSKNYQEFNAKYGALLQEDKEISYEPIKLSLLSKVESDDNYVMFFKLVDPTA